MDDIGIKVLGLVKAILPLLGFFMISRHLLFRWCKKNDTLDQYYISMAEYWPTGGYKLWKEFWNENPSAILISLLAMAILFLVVDLVI